MRKLSILFVAILSIIFSITVFAHPGSLDENGGHYDHSTGTYHYHDGTNQGNNHSNTTVDTVAPSKNSEENIRQTFYNSPLAIPFWAVLSTFTFALLGYEFKIKNNILKGLLSFTLFLAAIFPPVMVAFIISSIYFIEWFEFAIVIISAIILNIFFHIPIDLNKKQLIIFSILVLFLGLFTASQLQKQTVSLFFIIFVIIAIIGYFILDAKLKQNDRKQKSKVNSIDEKIKRAAAEHNNSLNK